MSIQHTPEEMKELEADREALLAKQKEQMEAIRSDLPPELPAHGHSAAQLENEDHESPFDGQLQVEGESDGEDFEGESDFGDADAESEVAQPEAAAAPALGDSLTQSPD